MLRTLATLGQDLARGMLQILYPGLCHACGCFLAQDQVHFCGSCRAALIHDPLPACPRCAGTVGPHVPLDDGCTRCRDHPLHFERAFRLGPYEGLLRELILRLKYQAGEELAETLGILWAAEVGPRLRESGIQTVVPIPLHWRRRWQRGYNQSDILGYALADLLRLPCRPGWLRRIRNTPMQTRQTGTDRRTNMSGAFKARAGTDLAGKTILLVDDVLTTGSTCSEAGRALREAGASRILVAVLAGGHG